MQEPIEVIASAVRRHRERAGLSQTELARRMKAQGHPWHQMTVARTETGERPIRLDEALALAAVLDIAVPDLYTAPPDVDAQYEALVQAALSAEESLARYREMETRTAAIVGQLKEEALRARALAEDAQHDYEVAVNRLQRAESEAAAAKAGIEMARERVDHLRAQVELVRTQKEREALIQSLEPGELVDITIENITGSRVVSTSEGHVFELLSGNGKIALRSSTYPNQDQARLALHRFMDVFSSKLSELRPTALERQKERLLSMLEDAGHTVQALAEQDRENKRNGVYDKDKRLLVKFQNDRRRATEYRRQLTDALMRIDTGTYGTCRDCGQDVEPTRLGAHPEAKRCASCQEARDEMDADLGVPKADGS